MAIDFPASPSLNDTFSSGGVTYTWDGAVWAASGSAAFVQKSGDTMSGALAINADLTVDTDTLYVDSTNNRVGIGTNSPQSRLNVQDNTQSTPTLTWNTGSQFTVGDSAVQLAFGRSNSSPFPLWLQGRASNDAARNVAINPVGGNVGIGRTDPAVELDVTGEIRASTGILFGTDTAAANTLDDYEEGTWTPDIEGATTAGSYTFTSTGAYTKVGNKVTVWGELTNITTVSAGSGVTRVTGLPFTSALGFDAIGSIMLDQWTLSSTAYIDVVAQVVDNVNYMTPRIIRDGATDIGLQITDKTNDNADIRFCITYTVA